jgi:hypothetical protein
MTLRARILMPYAAIAIVAFAVRAGLVLRAAGYFGSYGYDQSVYYAAADALLHGRIPYSDFVLLHPPMVMLALVPSAIVGHLTTDLVGFAAGNLLFTVVGALDAALVAVVARRAGLSRAAAVAGGLFYAVWFGAAGAEYSSRLEPLGNLFLLLALRGVVPLVRARTRADSRALFISGVAFALAANTKIWFAVPFVVVLGWLGVRGERAAAKRVAVGAVIGAMVVDVPFLALSRGAMFSHVVIAQLARARRGFDPEFRLEQFTASSNLPGRLGHLLTVPGMVVVAALGAAAILIAGTVPASRLFAALAVTQLAVLLLAPSWFAFYADFASVPLALCVAGAGHGTARAAPLVEWTAMAAALGVTATVVVGGTARATTSWRNAGELAARLASLPCVMSDSPAGLIELDRLDRDLAHGCTNWVDVTGRTYVAPDKSPHRRSRNARWQRDLTHYLLSGQAAIIVRASGDGMTPGTRAAIERGGQLAHRGRITVYATPAHRGPVPSADRDGP